MWDILLIAMMELTAMIEQDEDGMFCATIKELKGCHTQAKTLKELKARVEEAIHLFVENDVEIEVSFFDTRWV